MKSIYIPGYKDGKPKSFGFVEFSSSATAHYACDLLNGIKLYNQVLTVRPHNSEKEKGLCDRSMPNNMISALQFYHNFYCNYEEVKYRPHGQTRRNPSYNFNHHEWNNSFTPQLLNRSISSPSSSAMFDELPRNASDWNQTTPLRSLNYDPQYMISSPQYTSYGTSFLGVHFGSSDSRHNSPYQGQYRYDQYYNYR